MKAKQELLDYLISNINEKNLLSQIKRLNLDRILLDEIKSIDLNEYNTIHKMMILQKLHNHIILNEINKIIKISDNFNIKVIQLKGIFLAAELYNPIEIRKTSDIDILVKNDQIGRFLDVIGSLGYTWRYNKKDRPKQVSKEMINIFYCSYDNNEFLNYHVEFKKNINYFGRDLEIVLEVHTTPLNRKKQYNQYINKKGSSDMLVERAEKKYLLGYNVWILELHDKLIHLMYHFVRHYIHDLRSFFSFSCSIFKVHRCFLKCEV